VKIVFESGKHTAGISVILLDWSCRESFHSLHYLARQSVPRDAYEIVWIEYYSREAPEIAELLRECQREHRPPAVDRWIVMGMPGNVYYHKHLMYNVGLVASRGELVVLCDSDAMMRPTFIEAILAEFERDKEIVLHLDEVRNNDRRFYPFNYPSFEEVTGPGAVNWTGTTTTGLVDTEDPLHSRNYGACMVARRSDLIAIGGADEHIDYLGHICGPYEMTFRLVNAGKREVWHPSEFLYHTWHPGQAGDRNYLGPHDGRHMSTTALDVRVTGRVLPLVENPAVAALRLGEGPIRYVSLLDRAIPAAEIPRWTVANAEAMRKAVAPVALRLARHPVAAARVARIAVEMLVRQTLAKIAELSRRQPAAQTAHPAPLAGPVPRVSARASRLVPARAMVRLVRRLAWWTGRLGRAHRFLKAVLGHASCVIARIDKVMSELAREGTREVAVLGSGDIARLVAEIARAHDVQVVGVYDHVHAAGMGGSTLEPAHPLHNWQGKIIVASVASAEERVRRAREAGVAVERLVRLV
jgi:hypothetical protein